ncbi:MAG TPA: lipopolysaccharide kinase InaA family protein [Candidatus Paceibacterota bacterium]|nr:lipopolysaccharide kinase InaA family protein [Candidatus Paceibacterota bacterium]
MESFPEHLKISRSAETLDPEGISVEKYIENLEADLKEELERIIREEKMIGEGRAAQVFEVSSMPRSKCKACVKIWRRDLLDLKLKDPIEYRRIQSLEPEEEFNFQDELYMRGFTSIPRPFAFTQVGDFYAMGMEKIEGYTLQQIKDAGAQIEDPAWKELDRMIFDLNINKEVLHRDIHEKNIMLRTNEDMATTKQLKGELVFLDFGHSKRIYGRPMPEDYKLTVGKNVLNYPQDKSRVEALKPNPRTPGDNIFAR